jgi:hypothetical protein
VPSFIAAAHPKHLVLDAINIHISAMGDREFSSPVCYLDFDRVPATPPEPSIQEASSHRETGAPVPEATVLATPGPFMDASVASQTAAPVAAPPLPPIVACAVDSNPASNGARADAATDAAAGDKPGRNE